MRLEVASQFHLQLGPAAVGACRGQAYCLFVLGPLGQGAARLGPILPTVSLASSAVWCLLLVWASLGERPGGCRRGRVLWFLCPCPCRCPGPYASVCVWVCSPATRSTRSLTQQHCQLFPLNTTSPLLHCPPLPTPGEIVPPLMRSHILMSSDVSGIPSFLPPLPSLCVASLWEHTHTLRSLVKT